MKKLLLAAAVMTTFASASAFAQFGSETEGENTGNITIGGEISGAPFKWVSAIDSNPAGLNSKTAKTLDDWKAAQNGSGYTMDLGLTAFEPLVYVRTVGNAATNSVVPSITMTGAGGDVDVTKHVGTEDQTKITAQVKMGSSIDNLTDATDVNCDIEILFNYGYGYKVLSSGQTDIKLANNKDNTGGILVSLLSEGHPGYSSAGWYNTTYSWSEAIKGWNADGWTDIGFAGLAGATSAVLTTTSTTRPTGFWQASIPVTVSYK